VGLVWELELGYAAAVGVIFERVSFRQRSISGPGASGPFAFYPALRNGSSSGSFSGSGFFFGTAGGDGSPERSSGAGASAAQRDFRGSKFIAGSSPFLTLEYKGSHPWATLRWVVSF
jgi:hypothetical protein